MKLSDWILLSREERTAHIDLSTPCQPDKSGGRKKHVLLEYHSLENDCDNWTTARVHRCHLCKCGRRKGWCVNPLHFYFGTASENQLDTDPEWRKTRSKKCGTAGKGTSPVLDRVTEQLHEVEGLSCRKAALKLKCSHHVVSKARKLREAG